MNPPVGLLEIFKIIVIGSFLSIGGGNGPVAIIQTQWVNSGILDPKLLAWVLGLSYLTPGPKAGYLPAVGYYLHGVPGAIITFVGMLLPPCISSAIVEHGLEKFHGLIAKMRNVIGYIIAGLILTSAIEIMKDMNLQFYEVGMILIIALSIGVKNLPPIWIILGALFIGLIESAFPIL